MIQAVTFCVEGFPDLRLGICKALSNLQSLIEHVSKCRLLKLEKEARLLSQQESTSTTVRSNSIKAASPAGVSVGASNLP